MARESRYRLALQKAIARQIVKDQLSGSNAAVADHHVAHVKGTPDCERSMVLDFLKPVLEVGRESLTIEFPGLALRSANAIAKNPRVQAAAAKNEAKNALCVLLVSNPAPVLWRFDGRVDVCFTQYVEKYRIDSENLWTKPLLDGLTIRGLGIIVDDSPKFVRSVTRASEIGATRVVCEIRLVEVDG